MRFTLGLALATAAAAVADESYRPATLEKRASTPTAAVSPVESPTPADSPTPAGSPRPAGTPSNGASFAENGGDDDSQYARIETFATGQCQFGNSSAINSFYLKDKFPSASRALKPTFKGAESKNGGGWDVYWSIPQPKLGCRTLVMLPYTQHEGVVGYPAGNEIINAGDAGCYFGNVPTDADVLVSYCCGSKDCESASLNSTDLLAAPEPAKRRSTHQGVDLAPKPQPKAMSRRDELAQRARHPHHPSFPSSGVGAISKTYERARRWFYEKPKDPNCKMVKPGQPYSQAGQQIVVSRSQSCSDSPCSIAVSFTTQVSTTMTSSTDTTLTVGFDASVSLQAGVDFLVDAKATASLGVSVDSAVSQSTGMSIMKGNQTQVTNTIPIHMGNRGVVTFTPTYKCFTSGMDCGYGASDPITWCQPDMSGPGGTINGAYNALAFG